MHTPCSNQLAIAWLLIRSHRKTPELKEAEAKLQPVDTAETPEEVMRACIGEVCTTMQEVTRIYNRTLVAVFKENRKVLKEMVQESNRIYNEARERKYGIMPTLRRLQRCDIDTGHFYVQVTDYISEVTKALIHITRPSFDHIDNNHEGLSKEQIVDLMHVNDEVEAIFDKINDMLASNDFSDLDLVLEMRDRLFETMQDKMELMKLQEEQRYAVMQYQINPHFLYNTLNSIKWMATIQGATGISEMTTSLSRLLKSISKGTSLLIDIREELSLLENYFTIQSYRYGGTITMDIQVDNESLYNSEIIKFTLQPLVENAIFHGIEPKGCAGHIRIHVGYETSDNTEKIRIDVTDDGVGMTADKAAQVLRSNDDSSADFFREIGVSNVHKRLQYQFGAEYGITIESKEGEYTTMSIHIPNIPLHNNETVSSETISSENT